jgi:hypothetical protein
VKEEQRTGEDNISIKELTGAKSRNIKERRKKR